jgi:hypothetical protein
MRRPSGMENNANNGATQLLLNPFGADVVVRTGIRIHRKPRVVRPLRMPLVFFLQRAVPRKRLNAQFR